MTLVKFFSVVSAIFIVTQEGSAQEFSLGTFGGTVPKEVQTALQRVETAGLSPYETIIQAEKIIDDAIAKGLLPRTFGLITPLTAEVQPIPQGAGTVQASLLGTINQARKRIEDSSAQGLPLGQLEGSVPREVHPALQGTEMFLKLAQETEKQAKKTFEESIANEKFGSLTFPYFLTERQFIPQGVGTVVAQRGPVISQAGKIFEGSTAPIRQAPGLALNTAASLPGFGGLAQGQLGLNGLGLNAGRVQVIG